MEELKYILLSESNHAEKGYILYDSNYMTFWGKIETMKTVKRSTVARNAVGGQGVNRPSTADFRTVEDCPIIHDIMHDVMTHRVVIHF